MTKEINVNFTPSLEEKNEINEMLEKLSGYKKYFIIVKCQNAVDKIDEVKSLLLAIRDSKPIKIE